MDGNYHLTKCLDLIQEQLQGERSSSLTNKDFEILSEKNYDHTGILISYPTLRRLFGKVATSSQYKPQLETKNALALFVGFKDWDTFKRAHPLPQPAVPLETPGVAAETEGKASAHPKKAWPKALVLSTLIAVIIIIGVTAFFLLSYKPTIENISFTGKNTVGTVPLNTVFHYDIRKVQADSIILDFGTEGKKMVLPKNKQTVTMSYLIPGLYKAYVRADNKIIGQETIHAKSAGWMGIIYTDTDYFFLQDNTLVKEGVMRYLPAYKGGVPSNAYKPIKKADVVEFNNFEDFGVSGDNFIFETRLRVVLPDSGNYCYKAYIKVKGDNHPIRAAFVNKGCNTDALLQFGEIIQEGKFHDLALMGQSFTGWRTVRIEVKNKQGRLFLDNQLLYSISFQRSIGMIKGLSFRLREFGEVDYVRLYDGEKQLKYAEDFSANSPQEPLNQ